MTPVAKALLLGAVQGLTEFFPVSSSGHLVLGEQLLHAEQATAPATPVTFAVAVHVGTLLATLVVFWAPVRDILVFLWNFIGLPWPRRGEQARDRNAHPESKAQNRLALLRTDPSGRLLTLILLGTIPAVVVGALFEVFFEEKLQALFENALFVGIALLVTGGFLLLTRWSRERGSGMSRLSVGSSLLIGMAQAIAIAPGISRSGATIGTALLLGTDRQTSARFSFLLSVPAIACATLFEALKLITSPEKIDYLVLAAGFAGSLAVGYVALRLLLGVVHRGRLYWFAYYCWIVGLAAVAGVWLGLLHS